MTEENAGFDFLTEAAERSQEDIDLTYENGAVERLIDNTLGKKQRLAFQRDYGTRLTWAWFEGMFPNYPFRFVSSHMRGVSVQQLFQAPTKTKVFERFKEQQALYDDGRRYFCMFFRVEGFTTLAIFDNPKAANEVRTCIRFAVRGFHHFISTSKDLIDVCREKWPLGA